MPLDGATRDRYTLIANLLLQQVTLEHIAAATNLSPGRISQIKDEPEFQEIYQKQAVELHGENKQFDEGWDAVEKQALASVLENLSWNKDPDFALKAAVLSNKAQRRTRSQLNNPIPAGNAGARVIINLQPQFITKLQNYGNGAQQAQTVEAKVIDVTPENQQKQVNTLLPGQVEKLLFNSSVQKKDNLNAEQAVELVFGAEQITDGS